MPQSTNEVVRSMVRSPLPLENTDELLPVGPGAPIPEAARTSIPGSLDELPEQVTRTYDLSVTAASDLNIPVIGSVSGTYSRRVVVLERTAFKSIEDAERTTRQYGYAIRLCLTVSKIDAEGKLSLPFLAASAELGRIHAQWILQIVGLAGPKIDKVNIIPRELNVETFVLAKQSLAALIQAVRDETTSFTPQVIAERKSLSEAEKAYRKSVATAFALAALSRGRTLGAARERLGSSLAYVRDTVGDVYRNFAGIADTVTAPSDDVRRRATDLLEGVRIRA